MPVELRALIFVFLSVSLPIMILMKFAGYYSMKKDFQKWVIVWVVATTLSFLSYNFWLFLAFMCVFLLFLTREKPILKISLFFVLLPSFPPGFVAIPGFGLINFVINVSFPLFLSTILLLPLVISNTKKNKALKVTELFLYSFFALSIIMHYQESSFVRQGVTILRESSVTGVLRYFVSLTLGMLIPFLAISRTVKSTKNMTTIFMAIIFGTFMQTCIGIVETYKSWHLYNSVSHVLNLDGGIVNYLTRQDILRASSALGHPIFLGFIAAIGMGVLIFFHRETNSKSRRLFWLLMTLFAGGLIVTLSRGPWVGAVIMVLCFFLTGKSAVKKVSKFGVLGVIIVLVMSAFPVGQSITNIIPYLNSEPENSAASTITYRERLFEQSLKVIAKNPILGTVNYLQDPDMEVMRQGEGIIDMVNSYLGIALEYGLVGLSLYLSIFLFTLIKVRKIIKKLTIYRMDETSILQGRIIFSTMTGMLAILFTTSSGIFTSYYLWSFLGLAGAFVNISQQNIYRRFSEVKSAQVSSV